MLSGLYHHIKRGTAAGDEQHDRVAAALADRTLKVGHAGDVAAVHLLDHVAAAQAASAAMLHSIGDTEPQNTFALFASSRLIRARVSPLRR